MVEEVAWAPKIQKELEPFRQEGSFHETGVLTKWKKFVFLPTNLTAEDIKKVEFAHKECRRLLGEFYETHPYEDNRDVELYLVKLIEEYLAAHHSSSLKDVDAEVPLEGVCCWLGNLFQKVISDIFWREITDANVEIRYDDKDLPYIEMESL